MKAPTRSTRTGIALAVIVAALGVFMLGLPAGILPAFAIVLYLAAPEEVSRSSALAALVLLGIAALATLVEGSLSEASLNLRFARDRELASTAAAAAGGLLAVAAVTGAILERTTAPPPPWSPAPRARLRRRPPAEWGVLALAGVVRLALAPQPLGPDASVALDNLRAGTAMLRGLGDGVLVPPLAPLVLMALPALPRLVLVAVGVGTVAVTIALGRRLGGPPAAVAAGTIAALLPALWGQQLPEALATLLVTGAVAVLLDHVGGWRAPVAGLLLALAVLAEPTTVLALPVVALWTARRRDGMGDGITATLLLFIPVLVLLSPLVQWSTAELDRVWPRGTGDAVELSQPLGLVGFAVAAALGAVVLLSAAPAIRSRRLLLGALPVVALVACWLTESSRGLWGWGGALVAAGAGTVLAVTWRRRDAATDGETTAMGGATTSGQER